MTVTLRERETTFHDSWASSTDAQNVRVREAFESPTALENRFILEIMAKGPGSLRGKKLLEIGCGLGEASTYFALEGAEVTATDTSTVMLERSRQVARQHGVDISTVPASAERLPFPEESFDIVYVANTIHHLERQEAFFLEAWRVLRQGGWFFSWDPLAYNPLINVYRRMATQVRTADEAPLRLHTVKLLRKYFPNLRYRCFWLASLALFLKYYLVDRIHPNRERYWKRIYQETDSSLRWWKPLLLIDALLTRVPLLQLLAWNVVLWGRKSFAPRPEISRSAEAQIESAIRTPGALEAPARTG